MKSALIKGVALVEGQSRPLPWRAASNAVVLVLTWIAFNAFYIGVVNNAILGFLWDAAYYLPTIFSFFPEAHHQASFLVSLLGMFLSGSALFIALDSSRKRWAWILMFLIMVLGPSLPSLAEVEWMRCVEGALSCSNIESTIAIFIGYPIFLLLGVIAARTLIGVFAGVPRRPAS